MTHVTQADEGKTVVNEQGDAVGLVTGVREGTVYVDPDPDLTDTLRSELGLDQVDGDDHAVPESSVAEVTEGEVRIETEP